MARAFYRRSGYVRPHYTHADRQRRQSSSGAATTAIVVPLALIAAGALLWKRSQVTVAMPEHDANALPGMSGFGSSFKKAVKKSTKVLTKVSPSAAIAKQISKATGGGSNPLDTLKKVDPVKNLHKSPVFGKTALVRKLRPRGSPPNRERPEPGQPVIHQDINGKTITEAEFNALTAAVNSGSPVQLGNQWAMPAGYMITAAAYAALFPGTSGNSGSNTGIVPPSSSSGTSFTSIYTPEGSAPNDPAGSSGPSNYELPPEAPTVTPAVQQYAPAAADQPAAAPADKKFNPLIAVGALIAVPVVMGLTGGK